MPPFPAHIPGKKAGFMGALAAVGRLKHHHGVPAPGAGHPDAKARSTSLNQDERMEVAILLNATPAWHDVTVERICDVMASAEHGKNRIKKLKFAQNKTLWHVGDEITRFGVYFVLSGKCQFTRKVRIVPKKEMKEVDPELQVSVPPSLRPSSMHTPPSFCEHPSHLHSLQQDNPAAVNGCNASAARFDMHYPVAYRASHHPATLKHEPRPKTPLFLP
jgi:hypothetical protein